MDSEYRFDYEKAKPNRFAEKMNLNVGWTVEKFVEEVKEVKKTSSANGKNVNGKKPAQAKASPKGKSAPKKSATKAKPAAKKISLSKRKNLQAINKKLGDFLYSILQKDYEKTPSTKSRKIAEMVKEYRFDYGKAKPNRFASRMKDAPLVAVIDSDMAKVFTTAEQVNKALRAVISAMPEK